jgi:hypothetical protein
MVGDNPATAGRGAAAAGLTFVQAGAQTSLPLAELAEGLGLSPDAPRRRARG